MQKNARTGTRPVLAAYDINSRLRRLRSKLRQSRSMQPAPGWWRWRQLPQEGWFSSGLSY
jgi:hypothetical protein